MPEKNKPLDPLDALREVASFLSIAGVGNILRDAGWGKRYDEACKVAAESINKAMTPVPGCESCYYTGHAHASLDPCPVCCAPKTAELEPHNVD